MNLDLARALLPGFGFFGAHEPFHLQINANLNADTAILSIEGSEPEFLNLGEIDFIAPDGRTYDREEIIKYADLSSTYAIAGPNSICERVLAGEMIHSALELRPKLTIFFTDPTPLSHLIVRNRLGICGNRSRHLVCTFLLNRSDVGRFRNYSDLQLIYSAESIAQRAGHRGALTDFGDSATEVAAIRERIIDLIVSNRSDLTFRELCWLLPLFAPPKSMSQFDITICSEIALRLMGESDSDTTHKMASLGHLISTKSSILKVQAEASRLASLRSATNAEIVLSKHAIHSSVLINKRKQYLEAIDEAATIFQGLGVTIMLCYGSLLGAIRENNFLPHDDDVDFLIYDQSLSRAEAETRRSSIIASLMERGYTTREFPGGNFHVIFNGQPLDFFICWHEADQIVLMMDKYQYRGIDASVVCPPSEIDFLGRRLSIPARSVEFLELRYGVDWKTPNQFHEWPWKLEE